MLTASFNIKPEATHEWAMSLKKRYPNQQDRHQL